MENASKALLLAAGVLITMLIASLAVYLFSRMSSSTAKLYAKLEDPDIAEFNQQFFNYEGRGKNPVSFDDKNNNGVKDLGEDDIYNPLTIQDVATIVNMSIDYNKNPKFILEKITVKVGGADWTEKYKNDSTKILENNIADVQEGKKFKCEKITIDKTSRVVKEIEIKDF